MKKREAPALAGWKPAKIKIAIGIGIEKKREIEAVAKRGFAVHPAAGFGPEGSWTVTHVRTGYALCSCGTKPVALFIGSLLSATCPTAGRKQSADALRAVFEAFPDRVRRGR